MTHFKYLPVDAYYRMYLFDICTRKGVKKVDAHLSLGPSVRAIRIGAYVVQSHFFFSSTGLRLEKHRFSMATLRTSMVFRSWQRWIGYNIGHNVRQFAI